jgi:hypothetical protein
MEYVKFINREGKIEKMPEMGKIRRNEGVENMGLEQMEGGEDGRLRGEEGRGGEGRG